MPSPAPLCVNNKDGAGYYDPADFWRSVSFFYFTATDLFGSTQKLFPTFPKRFVLDFRHAHYPTMAQPPLLLYEVDKGLRFASRSSSPNLAVSDLSFRYYLATDARRIDLNNLAFVSAERFYCEYRTRERIHRAVADARLLAIPASWGRVAALNPNWDRVWWD